MEPKESTSTRHFRISLAKSSFRILAGVALCMELPVFTGVLLILAEALGIWEEL